LKSQSKGPAAFKYLSKGPAAHGCTQFWFDRKKRTVSSKIFIDFIFNYIENIFLVILKLYNFKVDFELYNFKVKKTSKLYNSEINHN